MADRKEVKRFGIKCIYRESGRFGNVIDGLEYKLSKKKIENVEGKLVFEFPRTQLIDKKDRKKEINRAEVACIYNGWDRTRDFTTPSNMEASNMLANKLERLGVENVEGRLIFEFPVMELSIVYGEKERLVEIKKGTDIVLLANRLIGMFVFAANDGVTLRISRGIEHPYTGYLGGVSEFFVPEETKEQIVKQLKKIFPELKINDLKEEHRN